MKLRSLSQLLVAFSALAGLANASTDTPKTDFEARVEALRSRAGELAIEHSGPLGAEASKDSKETDSAAGRWCNGWINWGNWGNWNNWFNSWGNWCNF